MSSDTQRSEQDIFCDLAKLCIQPGYVHALAAVCYQENFIFFTKAVTEADLDKMYSTSRLIRTEINTLVGLMVKSDIDWTIPLPHTLQGYIDRSRALLEELHHCLSRVANPIDVDEPEGFSPREFLGRGEFLREPIFYGGESAYDFQYLELAPKKYAADAAWLEDHVGFSIEDARIVASAIGTVQSDHLEAFRASLGLLRPEEWTVLPVFATHPTELAQRGGMEVELVERVLKAFTLPDQERNDEFHSLHDFNAVSATPLIRMPDGEYLSLQSYALAEAIYDTPFYWMWSDEAYRPNLTKHRGEFAEHFTAERLSLVFGKESVYTNVEIHRTKASRIGEVDVLVIWGDRAIVVQAKSKRLTIESRKGSDRAIRSDFKQGIQAAYDQAIKCSRSLGDSRVELRPKDGRTVSRPPEIKEVYVFCVVSDHYPALSFQSSQFLELKEVAGIHPPLVVDVFALDVLTEMLQSPLYFLSYINRRANYADRIIASQELTILAYHLDQNLWIDSDLTGIHIGDDFSASLDIAMSARRTGTPGATIPNGILTRLLSTTLGRVIKEIESRPIPATIDLGFLLMEFSEDAITNISLAMEHLVKLARDDGRNHDASFGFDYKRTGLTIHCNADPDSVAGRRLQAHCALRKYKEKADSWFGLCISPSGPSVRLGVASLSEWEWDAGMEEAIRSLRESSPPEEVFNAIAKARGQGNKIGRNERCPCGSGLKYKKCCGQ